MKRTFIYRDGKSVEITGQAVYDRPSDYERVMLEGSMAERVLRGYRDEENRMDSREMGRRLSTHNLNPNQIKKLWSEP